MFKTTKGLILREVKYKEADRILTVLTDDGGKITAKARGALRNNSKTSAATQLFAFSELTMSEYNGKWNVTEGSTIEEFKGLRNDISSLALACYFAECVETLCEEDVPNVGVLRLILNCFFALSNGLYPETQIKTVFELKLMELSGYEPDLRLCAVCQREAVKPWFSLKNGVVCCEKCRNAYIAADTELDNNAYKAMRYIFDSDLRRMLSYSLPDRSAELLSDAAENYLTVQTERSFPTLSYWKQVK